MSDDVVLLAEDRVDDVLFVEAAFNGLGLPYRLVVVRDGRDAIDYFRGVIPYDDRTRFPIPQLMLLDLQMPNVDGFQVLEWLRKHPEFKGMPVVVFTASSYSPDVQRAYQMGANSFLTKSGEPRVLLGQLKNALEYWIPRSATPTRTAVH